ncbi:hypothetical protein ID866_7100 [Astraeus odoratus]|nr:hypothetical protein ID866_7100 [Astraeus odoratus]
MAGAFSGHLLDTFNAKQSMQSAAQPSIVTSGAMSFSPQAHGFLPFLPAPFFGCAQVADPQEDTAAKIAALQAKLNKKLGPEFISQRPGPGGGPKLTYAEGWKIINLANEVFGFNGWSSSIVNISTDFIDYNEESRRYNVGVTAIVRVTLKDGVYHEDVGYGMLENSKSKASALDKCKKEAVTDALKRTLRNFGNLLGNCLYDKVYAQEVVKIKVPPAKFDKTDLHRRPEFEDTKPNVPSETTPPPAPPQQAASNSGGSVHEEKPPLKTEAPPGLDVKPMAYVPRHLRQGVASAAQQNTAVKEMAQSSSRPRIEEPSLAKKPAAEQPATGLHTPIRTPAQRPAQQASSRHHAVERSLLAQNHLQDHTASIEAADPVDDVPVDLPCTQDNYGLNSDDEAFLAAVDLGEGDLGRPIDFDEGLGAVSVVDDSILEPGQESRPASARSPVIQHPQVQARSTNGSSSSSNSTAHMQRAATVPGGRTTVRSNANGRSSCSSSSASVSVAPATSVTVGQPHKLLGDSSTILGMVGVLSCEMLMFLLIKLSQKPPAQQPLRKSVLQQRGQRQSIHQVTPSTIGVKRSADAMQ